jgi:hypothetical protein
VVKRYMGASVQSLVRGEQQQQHSGTTVLQSRTYGLMEIVRYPKSKDEYMRGERISLPGLSGSFARLGTIREQFYNP